MFGIFGLVQTLRQKEKEEKDLNARITGWTAREALPIRLVAIGFPGRDVALAQTQRHNQVDNRVSRSADNLNTNHARLGSMTADSHDDIDAARAAMDGFMEAFNAEDAEALRTRWFHFPHVRFHSDTVTVMEGPEDL
ncbi:MAG: hypothetical protein OEU46_19725, partial [Alphaproteobacteria bacterium]|nr:hypothetical protein [Alphaproteobacteria bacterium]